MSSTWLVTFPNDNIEVIQNLNEFCRKHNLYPSCMNRVASGRTKQHKGYKCKRLLDGPQSRRN
jgi:hypothetical protein